MMEIFLLANEIKVFDVALLFTINYLNELPQALYLCILLELNASEEVEKAFIYSLSLLEWNFLLKFFPHSFSCLHFLQ